MSQSAVYRLADALEVDVRNRPHYRENDHIPYTLGYMLSFIEGIACRVPAFHDELEAEVEARIATLESTTYHDTTPGEQL